MAKSFLGIIALLAVSLISYYTNLNASFITLHTDDRDISNMHNMNIYPQCTVDIHTICKSGAWKTLCKTLVLVSKCIDTFT